MLRFLSCFKTPWAIQTLADLAHLPSVVQVLLILLILLAHSLLLLVAGFGIAHLYFATSMARGHLTLNQALHVYQHNYTDSLWFLGRFVHTSC